MRLISRIGIGKARIFIFLKLPKQSKFQNIFLLQNANKIIFKSLLQYLIYSHHEKIVSVDDKIGFISGIDLALGRFELGCNNMGVKFNIITF